MIYLINIRFRGDTWEPHVTAGKLARKAQAIRRAARATREVTL